MRARTLFILLGVSLILEPLWAQAPKPLAGYSPADSQTELRWESKFKAIPNPQNIRGYNKYLSAYPHNAGTTRDEQNAEWILGKFRQWGWDAHIETFYVLLPWPKERLVELVAPTQFKASLTEPPISVDPTSSQQSEQLPTYNMYSIDGDVTAPLVYVNYGMKEDYDQLQRLGVSVKGAIVIARYGVIWRGLKPKLAAEHGAVGCIIYSDPENDGYRRGDVYPSGAWRPREGAQRGSVMDMIIYPGDPLTPGIGATKDAKRLPLKDVKTLTKIPVLPISYGDAKPLLAALGGPVAPSNWQGALGITYHVGAGPAKVHLKVLSDWKVRPIHDVIARIPGAVDPDEWIIRGNHHDAWVNGSGDPLSGLTPELEEARAMGILRMEGWKPKRTIIYCAWDAEEPALLGSTEWVEEHINELQEHAVVYINSDMNLRGFFSADGSPTLQKFIDGVAKDIRDPETGLSVEHRLRLKRIRNAGTDAERQELRSGAELKIGVLGSGSDYSAFIDHAGISSLDLSYGGESTGAGVYHSIYDDFYWFSHFGDPGFVYGKALAQTAGATVMRLADADLLPWDFQDLANSVQSYVNQMKSYLDRQRDELRARDLEIADGVFKATDDPRKHEVPPSVETPPPFLNFAPLDNALAKLHRAADAYHKTRLKAEEDGGQALEGATLKPVNQLLMQSERKLTSQAGLPERPWYKNEMYAPGLFTGYDAQTLPAIQQELFGKKWNVAEEEILAVSQVLDQETALIQAASSQLERAIH